MSTPLLTNLINRLQKLASRKRAVGKRIRRSRAAGIERLEARAMLTVSLIGSPGTSLQIDYTNAVSASPTFDVSLSGGTYTITLSGDTFDQGNANGVNKTATQLTFAASAYPEYLIDTENSTGNTTVTFSGGSATTFLSGWLLSAGSGASNSFSDNIVGGATFQNGLVVQGFQTADINSDLTVAESTSGGISAGGSNANALSIEQAPSGLDQVDAINLADGVTITGSSGNINLTGSQLVLAGGGPATISAGGTATNTFFNTSNPSNLNLPAATVEATGATSGLSLSANGFIGGGDVTLSGAISLSTMIGSISLGNISTTSTFTASFDSSSTGSETFSANGLTATNLNITGPGTDDSVGFSSDVTTTTGGMTFGLGTTQTDNGLSFFGGNVTAATGDITLPAASIDGFSVQKFQTPTTNHVILGSKLQLFLGGSTPGSGFTQFQYGQLNGGLNLNNSTLDVQLSFLPAINASFTIFKNEGTGSRIGTFAGLANNATFIATDSNTNTPVDFRINYAANGDVTLTKVETAPTVATPASSSPSSPITADLVKLSVLGADSDTGESSLKYTWSTTGTVPAPVIIGLNGTNAAKNTTAKFTKPGLYHFLVTITDPDGMTTTSTVNVTVNPLHAMLTAVRSGSAIVNPGVTLTGPIGSLSLSFSADLNAIPGGVNSVTNPANWELTRYGVAVSNPISGITFAFHSPSDPYVAVLTFTQPLIDGGYQLIGFSTIHDAFGASIIGDANGTPSTNIVRNFYVGEKVGTQTDVAPELSGIEGTVLSAIGPLSTPVTSSLQIFDHDNTTLSGATIMISNNYQIGQDLMSFTNTAHIMGVWNAETGTLTLSGVDTISNYRAALTSVTYHNTSHPPNTSLIRTISFQVNDGLLPSNLVSRNLMVRANSSPPILTGLGGTETFIQNGPPVMVGPNLGASHPDGVDFGSAIVSFTNWQPGDRVAFTNSLALQHTFVEDLVHNTASLTLTGENTAANYQTELRSVVFYSVSGAPIETPRIATFTVTDILSNSAMGSQTIHITRPPVLSAIETSPLVYKANHPEIPPPPISATLLVTDPDSTSLSKATVQITAGYQNGANDHDLLSFVNQLGIAGSFNASTGTLTLSGTSSVGNYRTALRSVTFSTSGPAISAVTRTLTITAIDDTSDVSNSVTRNVTVTITNASPVLSGFSGSEIYIHGSAPIPIAPNLIISDSDSAVLASATITFTNWQGEDRLTFTNSFALQHTLIQDLAAHTANLTLTGNKTVAQYQATLRSVLYSDVAGIPLTTARVASIMVNDGFSNSNVVTGDITIQ